MGRRRGAIPPWTALGLIMVAVQQCTVAQEGEISDAFAKTPGVYFGEGASTITGVSLKGCEAKCTADTGCQSFSFAQVGAPYSSSFSSSSGEGLTQQQCVISATQLYYDFQWETLTKVAGNVERWRTFTGTTFKSRWKLFKHKSVLDCRVLCWGDPKCSTFSYRKADHVCLTTEGNTLREKGDWSYYLKRSAAPPTLSGLTLPKLKMNDDKALQIGHENRTSDGVVEDPSALKATESTAEAALIEQQIISYVAKRNMDKPVALPPPKMGTDGKSVLAVPTATVQRHLVLHLTVSTSKRGVEDNSVDFLLALAKALGAAESQLGLLSISAIAELEPTLAAAVPNTKPRLDLSSDSAARVVKKKVEKATTKVKNAETALKATKKKLATATTLMDVDAKQEAATLEITMKAQIADLDRLNLQRAEANRLVKAQAQLKPDLDKLNVAKLDLKELSATLTQFGLSKEKLVTALTIAKDVVAVSTTAKKSREAQITMAADALRVVTQKNADAVVAKSSKEAEIKTLRRAITRTSEEVREAAESARPIPSGSCTVTVSVAPPTGAGQAALKASKMRAAGLAGTVMGGISVTGCISETQQGTENLAKSQAALASATVTDNADAVQKPTAKASSVLLNLTLSADEARAAAKKDMGEAKAVVAADMAEMAAAEAQKNAAIATIEEKDGEKLAANMKKVKQDTAVKVASESRQLQSQFKVAALEETVERQEAETAKNSQADATKAQVEKDRAAAIAKAAELNGANAAAVAVEKVQLANKQGEVLAREAKEVAQKKATDKEAALATTLAQSAAALSRAINKYKSSPKEATAEARAAEGAYKAAKAEWRVAKVASAAAYKSFSTASRNEERAKEDLRLAQVAAKQLKEGRPKNQSAAEWAACEEALKNGARQNVVKKTAALNATKTTLAAWKPKAAKTRRKTENLAKLVMAKEHAMKLKESVKVAVLEASMQNADAVAAKLNADLKAATTKLISTKAAAADSANKAAQLSSDITKAAALKAQERVKLAKAQVDAAYAGIEKSLIGEEDLAKQQEAAVNVKVSEAEKAKESADRAVVKAKVSAEKALKTKLIAVTAAKKVNIPRGSNPTYKAANASAEQDTALQKLQSAEIAVESTNEKAVLEQASQKEAVVMLTKAVEESDRVKKSLDAESKHKEATKESRAKAVPKVEAAASTAAVKMLQASTKKAAEELAKLKANVTVERTGDDPLAQSAVMQKLKLAAAESAVDIGKVNVAQSELIAVEMEGVALFNKKTATLSAWRAAQADVTGAEAVQRKLEQTKAEMAQLKEATKTLKDNKEAANAATLAKIKAEADFAVKQKMLDELRKSTKKIITKEKEKKRSSITDLNAVMEKSKGRVAQAKVKFEAAIAAETTARKAEAEALAEVVKTRAAVSSAVASAARVKLALDGTTTEIIAVTTAKEKAEAMAVAHPSKANNLAVVNAKEQLRVQVEKKQAATVANDRAQQARKNSIVANDVASSKLEAAKHQMVLATQAKLQAEADRRGVDAVVRRTNVQLVAAEANSARVAAKEKMEAANKAAQKRHDDVAEEKAVKAGVQESKQKETTVKAETKSKTSQVEEASLAAQKKSDEEAALGAKAAKEAAEKKSASEQRLIADAKLKASVSGSQKSEQELNDMVKKEINTKGALQQDTLDRETKKRATVEVSVKESKSKTAVQAAQKQILAGIQAAIDANKEKLQKTQAVLAEALKGKAEAGGKVAAIARKEKTAKSLQTDALLSQKESSKKKIAKLKGSMGEQGTKAAAQASQKAGDIVREKANKEGAATVVADERVAKKMKQMQTEEQHQKKINMAKVQALQKAAATAQAAIVKIQGDIVKRKAELKEGTAKLAVRFTEQEMTSKEVSAKESHKLLIKQNDLKSKLQSSLDVNEVTAKKNLKDFQSEKEASSKNVVEKASKVTGVKKERSDKTLAEAKAKADAKMANDKRKLEVQQKTEAKVREQVQKMGADKERAFKALGLTGRAKEQYLAAVGVAALKAEKIKAAADAKYEEVLAPARASAEVTTKHALEREYKVRHIHFVNITAKTAVYTDSGPWKYGVDYPLLLAQMKTWKKDKELYQQQKAMFVPPQKYAIWLHELQTYTKKKAALDTEKEVARFAEEQKVKVAAKPNSTDPNSNKRMRKFEDAVAGNVKFRIHVPGQAWRDKDSPDYDDAKLSTSMGTHGTDSAFWAGNYREGWNVEGLDASEFMGFGHRRRGGSRSSAWANQMSQACLTSVWSYQNSAVPTKKSLEDGWPMMMPCEPNGMKSANRRRNNFATSKYYHVDPSVSVQATHGGYYGDVHKNKPAQQNRGIADAHQHFAYDEKKGTIQDVATNTSNYCLHADTPHLEGTRLKMKLCDGSAKQKWKTTKSSGYKGYFARGSTLKSKAANGLCVVAQKRECGYLGVQGTGNTVSQTDTQAYKEYQSRGLKMDSCGCEAACMESPTCKSWTAYTHPSQGETMSRYWSSWYWSYMTSYTTVTDNAEIKCILYDNLVTTGNKHGLRERFGSGPYSMVNLQVAEGAGQQQGAGAMQTAGVKDKMSSGFKCNHCTIYVRGGNKRTSVKANVPAAGSALVMAPCGKADLKWDALDINGPGHEKEEETKELQQESTSRRLLQTQQTRPTLLQTQTTQTQQTRPTLLQTQTTTSTAAATPSPTPAATPAPTSPLGHPKCTDKDSAAATGEFARATATTSNGRCREWAMNNVWGALKSGKPLAYRLCKKSPFKDSCKQTCCEAKLARARALAYEWIGDDFKKGKLQMKLDENIVENKIFRYNYMVDVDHQSRLQDWNYWQEQSVADHKYYMHDIMVSRNNTLITHRSSYDYNITWEKAQIQTKLDHATNQFNHYNTAQQRALTYPSNKAFGKLPEQSSNAGVLKVKTDGGYMERYFMLKFPDTLLESDDVVVNGKLHLHKISGYGPLDVRRVRCMWSRGMVTYTQFMNKGTETCSVPGAPIPTSSATNATVPLRGSVLNRGRSMDAAFCFKVTAGEGSYAEYSSEKAPNEADRPTLELMILREPRVINGTLPPLEDKETEKDVKAVEKVRRKKQKNIFRGTTQHMLERKREQIPGARTLSKAEKNKRDDTAKRRHHLEMAIFMYERAVKRNKLIMAKKASIIVQNKTETDQAAVAAKVMATAGGGAAAVAKKWGNFSANTGLMRARELEKAARKVYTHGHYMPLRAALKTMPHLAKVAPKVGAVVNVPARELGEQHGHSVEAEAVDEAVREATGLAVPEGQRVAMEKPSENDVALLSAGAADTALETTDATAMSEDLKMELVQLEENPPY